MASEAQITANRRNAQKSTGPRTAEGKAAVAQNALRHGLTARQVVCFDEKAQDFAAYHEALRAAFDPADAIEEQLVERIALCAWRMRRLSRIEARLIDSYEGCDIRVYGTQLATVIDRAPHGLATLSRYEAALDRALQRAHLMLERRQARGRGEFVLAPLAVEVAGLDAQADGISRPSDENENCETKPIAQALSHPDSPADRETEIASGKLRMRGRSALYAAIGSGRAALTAAGAGP